MLRAGMIARPLPGVYTFLPLGYKGAFEGRGIVREEMDKIGAQEIMMPALQPAELWHESGRWDDYGPELMRLVDRHDHGFCLRGTMRLITSLIRNELRSYKELPCTLYQIQVKFRDEIRPRLGLFRSREFIMKDAYSFHATQESLQETYDDMSRAYRHVCDKLRPGLPPRRGRWWPDRRQGDDRVHGACPGRRGRACALHLRLCCEHRSWRVPGPSDGVRGHRA